MPKLNSLEIKAFIARSDAALASFPDNRKDTVEYQKAQEQNLYFREMLDKNYPESREEKP